MMYPGPLLVSMMLALPGLSADDRPAAPKQAAAKVQPAGRSDEARKAEGTRRARERQARRSDRPAPAESSRTPAAPAGRIRPKGFRVEMLYNVPRKTQGSWVNMTVDPKGRLIVSDQYGKLYRVNLPPIGSNRRNQDRTDPGRYRDGPGAVVGFRQPVRRHQRQSMTAACIASATPTATTSTTRSSCSASCREAASTARTR